MFKYRSPEEITEGAEEVSWLMYWLRPIWAFLTLTMLREGWIYRQITIKKWPEGNLKYVPGIGMITYYYIKKERIDA